MAVAHLACLGLRRIALVGADFGLSYVAKRLEGARRAVREHGLELDTLELEPGGHHAGRAAALTQCAMQKEIWRVRLERGNVLSSQ